MIWNALTRSTPGGEGGQQREAGASLVLDNTYAPPTGETKQGAPPPHPRKGPRQSKTRTQGNPARKNEQTYTFSCCPPAPRRRGRQAANPRKNEKRTQNKKDPRPSEKRTQDAPPAGPAGRDTQDAPGRVNEYYIFLFFSFSLGGIADAVRKIRTASHRHKNTTLYLWAFSAVSAV